MIKIPNGLLLIFLFISASVSAIDISVTALSFANEDKGYLEIYSRVGAESVQWASDTTQINLIGANLEYLVVVSQLKEVFVAEKYNLLSPVSAQQIDFWDQKRFALPNGEYNLKLQYVDLNNIIDTFTYEKTILISAEKEHLSHSDILLLSKVDGIDSKLPFERNGFKYEPLAYNLINKDEPHLIFYTELYQTSASFSEPYFIKYYVENVEEEGFNAFSKTGYKKLEPKLFDPILIDFDVSKLKSGNYKLHVELNRKDKSFVKAFSERFALFNPLEDYKQNYQGDAAFETSFFQLMDREELDYSLKAIFPRVGNNQTELLNQIIRSDEVKPKKYFLYYFWSEFSQSDFKGIYDQYMKVADAVDKTYGNNVLTGFESHRGFYFLKYGKPDDQIYVEDEPTAPPYEIWIYNYLEETQQTNVRFLFYNPSLASNDFVLLHSTCRGERNNPRWELELYSDAYTDQPANSIDSRNVSDGFYRNARKIFDDF